MDTASQISLKHYKTGEQCRARSDCADALADMDIHWSQIPYGWFSQSVAHISKWIFQFCFKQEMYIEVFKKKQWRNYCLCDTLKNYVDFQKQVDDSKYMI